MARVVAAITTFWGPPVFHGYWGEDGYPDWVFHDVVAYWQREGRFAYVGCNMGTVMPIVLYFGVSDGRPPESGLAPLDAL
jgi:hypothetical protein